MESFWPLEEQKSVKLPEWEVARSGYGNAGVSCLCARLKALTLL